MQLFEQQQHFIHCKMALSTVQGDHCNASIWLEGRGNRGHLVRIHRTNHIRVPIILSQRTIGGLRGLNRVSDYHGMLENAQFRNLHVLVNSRPSRLLGLGGFHSLLSGVDGLESEPKVGLKFKTAAIPGS